MNPTQIKGYPKYRLRKAALGIKEGTIFHYDFHDWAYTDENEQIVISSKLVENPEWFEMVKEESQPIQ